MEFSWSEAFRVALIGFSGVFVILFILELSLGVISTLVNRFGAKPDEEKKEKK